MAKRRVKEKTKKYLGLTKEIWCGILLVAIMGGSALAYVSSEKISGQDVEVIAKQAVVRITFPGQDVPMEQLVNLTEGATAYDAFNQVAAIDASGDQIVGVSSGDLSFEQNSTHYWAFYLNSRLTFKDINEYNVKHGDYLELRVEVIG
jgi:hypothetical protein